MANRLYKNNLIQDVDIISYEVTDEMDEEVVNNSEKFINNENAAID